MARQAPRGEREVTRPSRGVAARFFVVLAVLVPSLVAVAGVGAWGLQKTADAVTFQYSNSVLTIEAIDGLTDGLSSARDAALLMLTSDDTDAQQQGQARLVADVSAQVEVAFAAARDRVDADELDEHAQLDDMRAGWRDFTMLVATGQLLQTDPHLRSVTAARVGAILDPVLVTGRGIAIQESEQAHAAYQLALSERDRSLVLMAVVLLAALVAGVGAVMWLIRSVLPRTLAYSRFAARLAEGDDAPMDEPAGNDEISQLGRVLQDMAARGRSRRLYEDTQLEFSETLQLTEDESEVHVILKRHLERSIPACKVTVLNRNNSADRLEAVTPVPAASPLRTRLEGAKPRSCLAVRQARQHHREAGADGLVSCDVCGDCASRSTCTPLLVGGEVIGSVLAAHEHVLDTYEVARVRESVAQSAPVLANLRNLAIAETRASTDALTGLPNKRAVSDSLKQMVAQALRTNTSLAVLMLDLDHFKHINDRLGHGRGDEVLASVGAGLRSALRDADFVGRYGGEEFVVLLPGVSIDGAVTAAEKIRSAFADIFVAELDRSITASIGIAMIPDHGGDPSTIERAADNALYAAKRNGRDRIEIAGGWDATLVAVALDGDAPPA